VTRCLAVIAKNVAAEVYEAALLYGARSGEEPMQHG